MFADIPQEEFQMAVDEFVARLLWEAGVDRPPVDARRVAEHLGLQLVVNQRLSHRGQFVRLATKGSSGGGQATIVVGPEDRPEREQWTIAHEIGEAVAHDIFGLLGIVADAAPSNAREFVASRCANCLLLPQRWFATDGRAFDWELFELKERYATASHELIARRMLEMPPPIVITLCDQGRVVWRRSNHCRQLPRLLPDEQDAWDQAHVTGLPADAFLDPLTTGLDRVRVWPVHESEWKREIIRSEIAEH
jgi:hypothetical protein